MKSLLRQPHDNRIYTKDIPDSLKQLEQSILELKERRFLEAAKIFVNEVSQTKDPQKRKDLLETLEKVCTTLIQAM